MSDSSYSLVDLKSLSEPLVKLLEAVEGAVGAVYEPTRIRRKAKADADALVTKSKAEIEVGDLADRARIRLLDRELRRQRNIESIVNLAAGELPDRVSEKSVDPDWVVRFFDACQDVSKEGMQQFWARLLAGEIAAPNSFSPRTVATVGLITQGDAEKFCDVSRYLWSYEDSQFMIQSSSIAHFLRERRGISYPDILHLRSIGLIEPGDNILFLAKKGEEYQWRHHGRRYNLWTVANRKVNISPLTSVGRQLMSVVKTGPDKAYVDIVREALELHDLHLT